MWKKITEKYHIIKRECRIKLTKLIEEFTGIFNDVVDGYKELSDAYKRERVKLRALKSCLDVKREAYQRKCDELDKVEEEYDRDYHGKYSKELLREINRE